jgi:hypothetical protein
MRNLHLEVTTRMLTELKNGAIPWQRPWSETPGRNTPCNGATNRKYNGVNVVLLWMVSDDDFVGIGLGQHPIPLSFGRGPVLFRLDFESLFARRSVLSEIFSASAASSMSVFGARPPPASRMSRRKSLASSSAPGALFSFTADSASVAVTSPDVRNELL